MILLVSLIAVGLTRLTKLSMVTILIGPLTQVENDARSKGFSDLWGLLKCRDSQLFQKSRSRWLKEGDANTGFFHASINRRR
jgi:hypothetical protein